MVRVASISFVVGDDRATKMKRRRGFMGGHKTREDLVPRGAAQNDHVVCSRGQWHSDSV
jgi:hypothetical protein